MPRDRCSIAKRRPPTTALSKKSHSLPSSIRRIIQPRGWRVFSAAGDSDRKSPEAAAGEGTMTMRRPLGMASFVAVLLVLALGHRWSVTASWFTSDKTCGERHATQWFVERLDMDCGRLLSPIWPLTWGAKRRCRIHEAAIYAAARAPRRVVVLPCKRRRPRLVATAAELTGVLHQ